MNIIKEVKSNKLNKLMKYIQSFSTIFILLLLGFTSCKDEVSVNWNDRQYVRIEKMDVTLNTGEKIILKAKIDSVSSLNRTFRWSIIDESIASIESRDHNSAVVTALKEGSTMILVESTDGELKYFSDLTVLGQRIVKILTIGNSFSEDAVENYLYDLAAAGGHSVKIGNMYIGGANLEKHWKNASENLSTYQLRLINADGNKATQNNANLKEVIAGENWDYISFQEVSQQSGQLEGYSEYLPKLMSFADSLTTNPDVKFLLHQTWSYAKDSNHDGFANYNHDQITMYNAIVDAVWQAKELAPIDLVVPAGTAIQNARTSYIGDRFTRDGYHLNLTLGRFTAASTWYESIFGDLENNTFLPIGFSVYDVAMAKEAAVEAVRAPRSVTIMTEFIYPEPNNFELEMPIFIDFGPDMTMGNYNNFRNPKDMRLSNLKDEGGTDSKFAIEVTKQFQGTLSRGLQNILGIPTTASQDMFFSDGNNFAESGLLLTNLNREEKYTLAFYGSINDHGTQTEYQVNGKTQSVGYLDNDNNLGRLVVIEDIEPADDATISITMKPGPENIHNSRFYGINTMMIYPEGIPVPKMVSSFVMDQPIYIDFGLRTPSLPFFNFDRPNNDPRFNLPDAAGKNTGISMSVTARFNGENQSGASSNSLGFPSEVSSDAFWSDASNKTSGFTLYNLNPSQQYKFLFFGSRDGVSDNRETKYVVKGANEGSGAHNASSNKDNTTIIGNIKPASDGTIDIILSAGPNNNNGSKYFYINAMIVMPNDFTLR